MRPIVALAAVALPIASVGIFVRTSAVARTESGAVWAEFLTKLRHRGSAGMLWQFIARCVRAAGRLQLVGVYERDLTTPPVPVRARVPVTIATATLADVDQLVPLTAWQEEVGVCQRKAVAQHVEDGLRRGRVCFVARVGARIVHCTWVAFGWQDTFTGRFAVLPDDAAYCGGSYTAADYRGLAIHTAVNAAILDYLRARGYRRVLAYVDFDNRSSRKTYERMRWHKRGDLIAFTPRGRTTRVLRISGRIEPLVERALPPHCHEPR